MTKLIVSLLVVCATQVVTIKIASADPSAMRSATRSSTQAITRAIRQQVKQALVKYRTRTNLNMRTKPKGNVIQTLKKGSEVVVLDQSNGDWWEVSSNNQTGWVHSGYLVK